MFFLRTEPAEYMTAYIGLTLVKRMYAHLKKNSLLINNTLCRSIFYICILEAELLCVEPITYYDTNNLHLKF